MALGKLKTFRNKLITGLAVLTLAAGITLTSKKINSYETGDLNDYPRNLSIHPLLVEELAEFYAPPSGIDFLVRRIQQGSINEDSPEEQGNKKYSRALNHFQHWQTGQALECASDYCNVIKPEGVERLLSASEWANSPEVQAMYPFGDHTWERVKEDYQLGIISEHFGYIFHLISDLTVPAHVRNDVHAVPGDKDDYEVWTAEHKNEIMSLVQPRSLPPANSLEELMSQEASFTGSNFYSDDSYDGTIGRLTTIIEGNKMYLVKNVEGKQTRIFRTTLVMNFQDDNCFKDEWGILGTKAVEYGAAALELLKQEEPTGSYCDPCNSDSDCLEGMICGRWEDTNITWCTPAISCSSNAECGDSRYICYTDYSACAPAGHLDCRNNDSWIKDNCNNWTILNEDCTANQTCENGQCLGGPTCTDNDGDGYGTNCPLGNDCNDNNRNINPGATEICDGIDNNCANGIDEGNVCGSTCTDDNYEPNDSINTARTISSGTISNLKICSNNEDWYKVSVPANQTLTMQINFTHANGDLDMMLYDANGNLLNQSTGSSDNETVTNTPTNNTNLYGRVYGYSGAENIYSMGVSVSGGPTCNNDCSPSGQKVCVGNSWKECGNYDADNCLEWNTLHDCGINYNCQEGECILNDNCVRGEQGGLLCIIDSFDSPGENPIGLAWDGTYLWHTDAYDEKLYKLSTTGQIITSFDTPGDSPAGLAWDGTYFWNVDNGLDKIYKLTTSGQIIDSFDTLPGVYDLSWDGQYLWCTDVREDKIHKLTTSGQIIGSFDAPGETPHGLAWDGEYFWNAIMGSLNLDDEKIYKLSTSGDVINTFKAPGHFPQGLTFDGQYLWHADMENKIYKLKIIE